MSKLIKVFMVSIVSLLILVPFDSWGNCSGENPAYFLDLKVSSCRSVNMRDEGSYTNSSKQTSALIKAKVLDELAFHPDLKLSTDISKQYEIKGSEILILMSETEIKNCESFVRDVLEKRSKKLIVRKMYCDTYHVDCRDRYTGYTMPYDIEHPI